MPTKVRFILAAPRSPPHRRSPALRSNLLTFVWAPWIARASFSSAGMDENNTMKSRLTFQPPRPSCFFYKDDSYIRSALSGISFYFYSFFLASLRLLTWVCAASLFRTWGGRGRLTQTLARSPQHMRTRHSITCVCIFLILKCVGVREHSHRPPGL